MPRQAHHGAIGRVAGDERGEKARLIIVAASPRNAFGLDLDAGIFRFELRHEFRWRMLRIVEVIPPAHIRRGLRDGGTGKGSRKRGGAG